MYRMTAHYHVYALRGLAGEWYLDVVVFPVKGFCRTMGFKRRG
jgi:hypothetical protein